jgi:hypothetical protein
MSLIVTTEYVLQQVAPPALPQPGVQYSRAYHDQLNNVLRLYFNRLQSLMGQLQASTFSAGLALPHISASSSVNQYATASNTPTIIAFNTLETNEGFVLNPSGTATCQNAAVYRIAYGLQMANTANAVHSATVWLRINGVDVPLSGVKFTLPARKNPSQPFELLSFSEIVFTVAAGDEVALWWAVDQAATAGGGLGLFLKAEPVQTTPYPHPAVPSAIGSITFVSAV